MRLPNPSFWEGKRVYVTGAEGFKGTWLTIWLEKLGAIVNAPNYPDICNKSALKESLERFYPDIVIHLAAVSTVQEAFYDPINAIQTNVVGTTILLDSLKNMPQIKAILNVTTDKVYHMKDVDRGYIESDRLGGLEMYAASKVCSEVISTVYQKTYHLPLATARAGNTIGGGDWKISRIIPNYIYAFSSKTPLRVDKNAIRPWQYVLDCLCGYLLLVERLYYNNSYVGAWNFASNEYESRSVQWIVDEMNKYFDPPVEYTLSDDRGYYETKILKLNSDKSHKVLGWEPKYNMEEMIKRTALWYKNCTNGTYNLCASEIDDYMYM